MHLSILSPSLIAVCFLAGAGMYLLLTAERRAVLWSGFGLAGLAMVLLWVEFGAAIEPDSVSPGNRSVSPGNRSVSPGNRSVSPGNRSVSPGNRSVSPGNHSVSPGLARRDSPGASPLFLLFAASGIITAGMTVTARQASSSAVWFLAALSSVAGLYLIHDAQVLAAGTLLVAGGGTATLLLFVAKRAEDLSRSTSVPAYADFEIERPELSGKRGRLPCGTEHTASIAREPLLVCIGGCLLAAGLIGSIHRSLAATSVEDVDRLRGALARRQTGALDGRRDARTTIPPQSVQAGWSLFVERPVAVGTSAALLLVALVAAPALISEPAALDVRGDAAPLPGKDRQ